MQTFKDGTGRTWEVRFNVGTSFDIHSALGINFLELNDKVFDQLKADFPKTFLNVMYLVCKEQCDKLDMTDRQFGESFVVATLIDAQRALFDELIDFFQGSPMSEMLKAARTHRAQIQATMDDALSQVMQKVDDKLTAETKKMTSNVNAALSAGSPES